MSAPRNEPLAQPTVMRNDSALRFADEVPVGVDVVFGAGDRTGGSGAHVWSSDAPSMYVGLFLLV